MPQAVNAYTGNDSWVQAIPVRHKELQTAMALFDGAGVRTVFAHVYQFAPSRCRDVYIGRTTRRDGQTWWVVYQDGNITAYLKKKYPLRSVLVRLYEGLPPRA